VGGGINMPGLKQWQRRFFIFSDTQKMLYYFKSADDVTKGGTARGMVRTASVLRVLLF
jgi:dynamin GTPase